MGKRHLAPEARARLRHGYRGQKDHDHLRPQKHQARMIYRFVNWLYVMSTRLAVKNEDIDARDYLESCYMATSDEEEEMWR